MPLRQLIDFVRTIPGGSLSVSIFAPPNPAPEENPPPIPSSLAGHHKGGSGQIDHEKPAHSSDFSTVNWFGKMYFFSGKQRLIVAHLWQEWDNGTPCVNQADLLDAADSECLRLRDLFKRNSAWGEMIQPGHLHDGKPGTYCLAKP